MEGRYGSIRKETDYLLGILFTVRLRYITGREDIWEVWMTSMGKPVKLLLKDVALKITNIDSNKSFIELCLRGEAHLSDIDHFVDEWHESDSDKSIEEFLGMTFEEYALWVENPNTLKYIIAARKTNVPLSSLLPQEKKTSRCKRLPTGADRHKRTGPFN